ncbi:hypothetical protein [Chondromyces apiculatus]|uniref:hypothetical protein n=1 Tax=Chondromyces apiculatus TaxID=51 RepID=UPI0005C453F7|nr:hypothetical protein [Chondromyces apiculatus]
MALPGNWGGTCLPITPLDAPQSLLAGATTVTACEPVGTPPLEETVAWRVMAIACASGAELKACEDPDALCAPPSGKPLEGSKQCVFHQGEALVCPYGYPLQYVFNSAPGDSVTCSPCTCLPPQESVCEALVNTYTDASCAQYIRDVPASVGTESCVAIDAVTTQVGSVQAVFSLAQPGSCTPQGGQMVGGGVPVKPSTFCCM